MDTTKIQEKISTYLTKKFTDAECTVKIKHSKAIHGETWSIYVGSPSSLALFKLVSVTLDKLRELVVGRWQIESVEYIQAATPYLRVVLEPAIEGEKVVLDPTIEEGKDD